MINTKLLIPINTKLGQVQWSNTINSKGEKIKANLIPLVCQLC